jgi:hypothetical protein
MAQGDTATLPPTAKNKIKFCLPDHSPAERAQREGGRMCGCVRLIRIPPGRGRR